MEGVYVHSDAVGEHSMIKHVVVVGEGAGAKMPLISAPLEYIEKELGPVASWADMAVTTSASAVIFSILSVNKISARDINILLQDGLLRAIFTPKYPFAIPRYTQERYIRQYETLIGRDIHMGDSFERLITTSFNVCDGRTHFFKSWEDKDGKMLMTDAACRSFAAPYFFGELQDKENKCFWGDGGIGVNNMPAWYAYAEARSLGWLNPGHHTHFLLLGGGFSQYTVSYKKGSFGGPILRTIRQVLNYLGIREGGLARASSTVEQHKFMEYIAQTYQDDSKMTVDYVNWENMPVKLDKMDNWRAVRKYYEKGLELAKTIDLEALKH